MIKCSIIKGISERNSTTKNICHVNNLIQTLAVQCTLHLKLIPLFDWSDDYR